jgi:hypothetical protein
MPPKTKPTKAAKLTPGDRVIVAGREYRVEKAKPKGDRVKLTLSHSGQAFASKVPAGDRFDLIVEKLHDKSGAQQRWAKPAELAEHGRARLGRGDPEVTKPPKPAIGDPWETPADRVERKLDQILGARLVAEGAEAVGYYVPPVDVSTVASHLALFHGVDPSEYGIDDMLDLHKTQHAEALNGTALKVNHWHTETRPGAAID